ncbi:hypothetical protein [Streptomyces graminilatus]|uniref:hypothetical protein n=1 Tax=Streptomyces graminilatus TaxID=1464070 RepID=UPI0006E1E05C|nr:hypothetical protein [Streptomyces graminilatus]
MKSKKDDTLRLALANVERNGGPELEPGVLPPTFCQVHTEVFVPLELDLLGMTELTYAQFHPGASPEEVKAANRRFDATQQYLKMVGFRAEMGLGNNPTGCFVRPGSFITGADAQRPFRGVRTPPTVLALRVPGAAAPIHVGTFHHSFNAPTSRPDEAFKLTSLVDKVKADRLPSGDAAEDSATPLDALAADPADPGWAGCWLLGDTNENPEEEGELVPHPDWTAPEVTDDVHRMHRAKLQPDGSWRSYTDVDEIMHGCRMYDAARWAAHHGQLAALAPTAGRARPDQGGPTRIDRFYMDAFTVQAVEAVHIIPMDGLSDHDVVVVEVSKRKLVEALLRRTVVSLPGWRTRPLLPRVITPSRAEMMRVLAREAPAA